jgi:O-antigen/teichoic acid export membrane protein
MLLVNNNKSILSIAKNSGWLLLEKALRLILNVIVGVWMARHLGPSEFGELTYIIAYIAFFQAIANLGLDGITVRDISKGVFKANNILGTVFFLRLTVGVLAWIIAVAAAALANGWQDSIVLLTALVGSVLMFQAIDTIDLWFQSRSQSRSTALAKAMAYLLAGGFRVIMIISNAPLIMFAVAAVVEGALSALGLVYVYQKSSSMQRWMPNVETALRLLKESWPFILSGVSIMLYMRLDQIMIKEMIGVDQLGVFAAVIQLATIWQAIPVVLALSLAPFVAKAKMEGELTYWNTMHKIFFVYAVLAWMIIIPVAIFSDSIVPFLYGEKYREGGLVLAIYVFTNLFVNMGVAQGLWMINEKRSFVALTNTLIGALVSIIGNWLVIPNYGIVGVSVVAVVSMGCSAVFANIFSSKEILIIQLKSIFLYYPGVFYAKN